MTRITLDGDHEVDESRRKHRKIETGNKKVKRFHEPFVEPFGFD